MRHTIAVAAALALMLAACGKTQDKVAEKAAEKAIEASMEKSGGGQAKVDLSGGTAKIATTDATGKTTQMEIGGAQVSEAELGLPFYPGAKPLEGGTSRIASPEGHMLSVGLHSDDDADKVAAFYRERLKAQAAGRQFMDMSGGDGTAALLLADEKSQDSLQVHVSKADKGSDIQIVASRKGAGAR